MDKTAIRNFAVWARNKLISDVAYRAGLMGITADGIADKLPQSTNSVYFYDIGTSEPYQITGKEITQRSNLAFLIKRKAKSSDYATAYTSIIEEVAYTWFNRLIAVRFMEVNDYLPSHVRVLSSESGKIEPDIVTSPFDVELGMTEKESSKILELKQNNESDELFKLLFIKQCNKLSEILPRLFEKTDDYTELLFNCSYIDQEGIVYRLTHDIPEEDFDINRGGQVEIIGWLYQYYNAELKDDTFALLKKNVKISKERIPSATQLFTPDWIVRYMIENSLGRLWTEGHANTAVQLRDNWNYYLEEAEQETEVQVQLNDIRKEYSKLRPEDIKLIDPCMGSGHILVYAFDVLIQIYESEGYSQRDAAIQILENNIFGLDIDERAAQLAYFAVMMKARQYNRRVLDGTHDCHVLAIQESNGMSTLQTYMAPFGDLSDAALRLINSYIDAKEYGSILNIPLTLAEIEALERRLDEISHNRSNDVEELMIEAVVINDFPSLLYQARMMLQKYDLVVTNPPYMGANNMNSKLSDFVKDAYPNTKSDMSTVFMEKTLNMCKHGGLISMINIPVWMFLSSYEVLRKEIIHSYELVNMLHFGRGIFGADFGTTAFVIGNYHVNGYSGQYRKLYQRQGSVDSIEKKEEWFINNLGKHYVCQESFDKIPGAPFAYWLNTKVFDFYQSGCLMEHVAHPKVGMQTSNNDKFLRVWFEIDYSEFNGSSSQLIWIKYLKGGAYRKWYGNLEYLLHYNRDKSYILQQKNARVLDLGFLEKNKCTWTDLTSSSNSFRLAPQDTFYDISGHCFFPDSKDQFWLLGYANSSIFAELLKVFNSTIHCQVGDVARVVVPDLDESVKAELTNIVKDNVRLSKDDWDSFETSWDFRKHPLI